MGPLPDDSKKNVPKNTDDDKNDDENHDGWQIGYAVQLNGIGFDGAQNDVGRDNVEDSDSDGYEGPGDGSDAEIDEYRRAGYQQLPLNQPEEETTVADESEIPDFCEFSTFQEQITKASAPPTGTLPTTLQKEFQNALNSAKNVHLKDSDFLSECSSPLKDLELDEAKINKIREVANNLKLTSPSWAKDIDDEKLKEMLTKIKEKTI